MLAMSASFVKGEKIYKIMFIKQRAIFICIYPFRKT